MDRTGFGLYNSIRENKMFSLLSFIVLVCATSLVLVPCLGFPAEDHHSRPWATGSLDSFISSQSPIALQGVLNNIGPNGAKVSGAASGLVIAGPSKNNPDCIALGLISLECRC